jgi:starch synthase (maltosyl-transferring)
MLRCGIRKATPDPFHVVLIAVSFDLYHAREAAVELPLWKYSLPDHASLEADELMTGQRFVWQRKIQQSRLAPAGLEMGVARVHPVRHTAGGSTIPTVPLPQCRASCLSRGSSTQ